MTMQHLDPETLSTYIDGELSPEETEAVESHLSSCAQCQRELQELRGVSHLVRELPQYTPRQSASIPPGGTPSQAGDMLTISRIARPLALAAILIIVAIAGVRVIGELTEGDPDPGEPIEFAQQQPDGTDSPRAASNAVEGAPEAAPDEMEEAPDAAPEVSQDDEAPAAELEEAPGPDDAPAPAMAPAAERATVDADAPSDRAGTDSTLPEASGTHWARIGAIAVVSAVFVATAIWFIYQRTRRR